MNKAIELIKDSGVSVSAEAAKVLKDYNNRLAEAGLYIDRNFDIYNLFSLVKNEKS